MPNRYGDEADEPRRGDKAHDCRNGWRGEDDDGRPIPCLLCRPHLRTTATIYTTEGIR